MASFAEKAFLKTKSKTYTVVNDVLAFVTVVSILSLVLETVPALSEYAELFLIIEWSAVVLFTLEYIGRLSVSSPRYTYPTSFFGVVDLVAILPTFLGLGNFTFLKSARALRIIRMLRMVRLAKVGRSGVVNEERFGVLGLNVAIYFTTLVFALFVTGTSLYLVEPDTTAF